MVGEDNIPTGMLVWHLNEILDEESSFDKSSVDGAKELMKEALFLEGEYTKKQEKEYRQKLLQFIGQQTEKVLKNNKSLDFSDKLFLEREGENKSLEMESRRAKASELPFSIYFFNHLHTHHSKDNKELKLLKYSPNKMAKLANKFVKKRKTKGSLSFNDHNHDKAYDEVKNKGHAHMSFFRGAEWGGRTHMNLMGIKDGWAKTPNGRQYSYEEIVQEAADSGALRIANHPARKRGWSIDRWDSLEAVEVWNSVMEERPFKYVGFLPRSGNRTALKMWNDDLKLGNKRTALGGTDWHFHIPCANQRAMLYPANIIPIPHNEPYDVRKAVKKGNVSIVTRPTAPKLFLNIIKDKKIYVMGENLKGEGKVKVRLIADYTDTRKRLKGICYNGVGAFLKSLKLFKKEFWELRFYHKKSDEPFMKVKLPKKSRTGRVVEFDYHYKAGEKDFVRAELWVVNKKLKHIEHLALTNPITFNY